eukprot:scaffold4624_cov138-Isochrysis_galbana.AAC.3
MSAPRPRVEEALGDERVRWSSGWCGIPRPMGPSEPTTRRCPKLRIQTAPRMCPPGGEPPVT